MVVCYFFHVPKTKINFMICYYDIIIIDNKVKLEEGAQTATRAHEILLDALKIPAIKKAVDDFEAGWEYVYGKVSIADL